MLDYSWCCRAGRRVVQCLFLFLHIKWCTFWPCRRGDAPESRRTTILSHVTDCFKQRALQTTMFPFSIKRFTGVGGGFICASVSVSVFVCGVCVCVNTIRLMKETFWLFTSWQQPTDLYGGVFFCFLLGLFTNCSNLGFNSYFCVRVR